jgi:hypothetical protein
MKKICSKCKQEKDLKKDFHINKKSFDGRCPECKPCKLARNTKYYKTDWMKLIVG